MAATVQGLGGTSAGYKRWLEQSRSDGDPSVTTGVVPEEAQEEEAGSKRERERGRRGS